MKPIFPWLLTASLLAAAPALAQQSDAPDAEVPPPPPLPPKVQEDRLEPTVEIRTEENRIVEEYSLDGRVYMVKVTPSDGTPPYYYLDEDGDGQLRLQPSEEDQGPVRPAYWKVKEWK